jgi:hypothetical protein
MRIAHAGNYPNVYVNSTGMHGHIIVFAPGAHPTLASRTVAIEVQRGKCVVYGSFGKALNALDRVSSRKIKEQSQLRIGLDLNICRVSIC